MTVTILLTLLIVGLAVGFVSGLVGVGGGVLIVPFLYFFYEHPGWSGTGVDPSLEAAVAHATSLFIIVPTALKGIRSYHRAGLVVWSLSMPIAIVSMFTAVIGARLALVLPPELLKVLFGMLLLASGVRLISSGQRAEAGEAVRPTLVRSAVTGGLVGLLSALLGIGGGLVAIPMLIHVVGLEIGKVAATSLAVVLFSATSGALTYVISGWNVVGLPPGSLGYVHVAAAIPILIGAIVAVSWGATVNQKMPANRLRWVFAILFAIMGVWLVAENLPALI